MDPLLKRPTGQETEEDLLRYQQEFLASVIKPSVDVTRHGEKRKPSEPSTSCGEEQAEPRAARDRDIVRLGGKSFELFLLSGAEEGVKHFVCI